MDLKTAWSRLMGRTSKDHKRFVLFVFVLGAVLRVIRMNGPVTYDEAMTYVHYARMPFGFIFSDYIYTSNHILHSALVRVSVLLFGPHLWSIRLPALFAGILVMPLFYAFVRVLFNRHIAVLALCLVAVSGPLVEYSAMARGYSLTWLFTMSALLAVRHFIKQENAPSLVLVSVFCALGMWSTPVMTYPALMVYAWGFFMLVSNYESTLRRRALKLIGSFLLFFALCCLCYLPVIIKHSLDELIHHPSLADNTWDSFVNTQQDRVFDLWAYFTGTAPTLLAAIGAVAVIYAAYASLKYRLLVFALLLGSVPLVILVHLVASPPAWIYSLLVLHTGSAIGLFYLLKFIQDKVAPGFAKPRRTLLAGLAILLVFGWFGVVGEGDPVERYPEARPATDWIIKNSKPGDRVCAALPWDATVEFLLACDHGDPGLFKGPPARGGSIFILVGPGDGQTPLGVLKDAGLDGGRSPSELPLRNWKRLELFTVAPTTP